MVVMTLKKLTKMKIINWHYIQNETIEIRNNVLVTGQNATGKSTILDALQFVLTAGDQSFNLAAHDHGNRSLKGYIRCKLGIDNQEYLRQGDVTSHISLEFHDTESDEYITLGAVLDYKEDVDSVKSIFYSTAKPMCDEMFIQDGVVLSINNFKKTKLIDNVYLTKRETKTAFRLLFGSVNERFFTLIQKALAFKPISNVKDFIYQYLLEEKKIDVQNIQESIRSYKDLESTLKVIKGKINDLSVINEIDEKLVSKYDKSVILDLLLILTSIDDNQKKVSKFQNDLLKVESEKDQQGQKINDIANTIAIYDEKSRLLYNNLMSNDAFKNKAEIEKQVQRLKSEIELNQSKKSRYLEHVAKINRSLNDFKIDSEERKCYKSLKSLDLANVTKDNFEEIKGKLIQANQDIKRRLNDVYRQQGRLETDKKEKGLEYEFVVKTIKTLEGKKLRYNPNVVTLKNEINARIKRITDMDVSVNILAELLEVTDKEWQPAIENYLNTQRFNLIIDPKYYDLALDIYDEVKKTCVVYGVGLVNTKRISEFDHCDERSLAALITSNNVYAKRYINMVLGNVIRCDNVHDLEKYRVAITKDSMAYSSFTVRQLNDRIEKPFLGKDAANQQLKKFQNDERNVHREYVEIDNKMRRNEDEINLIHNLGLDSLIEEMSINLTIANQLETLNNLESQKNGYNSASVDDIQREYEITMDNLKRAQNERLRLYEENGGISSRIDGIKSAITELNEKTVALQEEFQKKKNEHLSIENEVYETYNVDRKKYRTTGEIVAYYRHAVDDNQHQITVYEDQLKAKQLEYNQRHNFQSAIGHVCMEKYSEEYDKLVRSKLVEYEDRVRQAREDTERLFKEDFISKLRSYIIQAQDGVRKINEALCHVRFGDDQYEFIFPKSKEFSAIYDMVLSDSANESGPIITEEFMMKYNQEMEELFDNLAIDEVNSEGVINKFTDYRTYMDYDIKITNTKGETTLFSKVFKEKSGGETQVPFYVSIIASFVQLYSSNTKSPIGIIIFDEAFDKMDSNRIRRMMEFIRELNLQIVIAATPQKMESITKYVDTTLIMLRKGQNTYVYSKINKEPELVIGDREVIE